MKTTIFPKASALALALLLSASWVPAHAQSNSQVEPDNTKVNKRDRNAGAVTADQQKETAADRDMAAKIRKALTSDKTLSTYAHNVKVVSQNGTVTLKGPVRSDAEVQAIVSKATEVAGNSAKIDNQLSVKP
jgi:osmotically-inducible protein OsmY